MKNFIGATALSLLFVSGIASAQVRAPGHYSAHFEITDVSSSCPAHVQCIAAGQVVTMTAIIGCADKLVYKDFQVIKDGTNNVIHATSLVKRNPNSDRIRCIAPNIVTEKVTVWDWSPVTLVNSELE
jgi:hypothetical protein